MTRRVWESPQTTKANRAGDAGLNDVRPSPIAGRWYPASADELAQSVDRYLAQAEVEPVPGEVIGLVAPHAGLPFSGPVAAYAYRLAQGLKIDTAAVLCPSHYLDLAPVITSGHAAYATPLGTIPVDQAALAEINRTVPLLPVKRDPEHAIEMELPFLQRALGPGGAFTLIPLMLRDQGREVAQALGQALARALAGRKALLVASSDLSHFHPQPAAETLDANLLERVAAFDPDGVLQVDEARQGQACGKGAIAAVLWAAAELGASGARVVRHATSGDITGEYDSVVGYGAAVIWK